MEKNQLIKYHGTIYRVLAVEDGSMLLIDCMERKMPKWHRVEDIDGYEDCTEEELVSTAGIVLTEERSLKPKAGVRPVRDTLWLPAFFLLLQMTGSARK